MSIFWWLFILVTATFWHELGHYLLARWQGVGVKSFSVGMGPVLARWHAGGTEWRLSALPIGGYVEIDGMAPTVDDEGRVQRPSHGFARLGSAGKIAVLLAGPLFNVLLAVALLAGNFAVQGVATPAPDRAVIGEVVENSAAARFGFRAGDEIVAINGQDLPQQYVRDGEVRAGYLQVQDALLVAGRKSFEVLRDGERRIIAFDWEPRLNGERRLLGIRYGGGWTVEQVSVPAAIAAAARTSVMVVPQAVDAFAGLFGRFVTLNLEQNEEVAGPIRTVGIIGQAAEQGAGTLIRVAAAINLSLALFNLFPIPGLDGGRILLVAVQAVLRRRLTFEQENLLNIAGFAFVMLLMVFVVVGDVARFF